MEQDINTLIEQLNQNWRETQTLTLKIYGYPEDIIQVSHDEGVSNIVIHAVLREREIFFRETLEQLNKFSLCNGCNDKH